VKTNRLFLFLVLLIAFFVLSVPLWLKIDQLPIRLWDESRNAVNAIEMHETGDLIVRSFNHEPETYNLKPPLLTWLQSFFISMVGINELAIRLPSLLASLGTLFLVYLFVYGETKKHLYGLFGAAITATSAGFYGEHVGRFGDHDALLVFFSTLLVYAFWRYTLSEKSKWIYLAAAAVCLGVLVKSISILLFLPALLLYLLYTKKLFVLLKNPHFYVALASALLPIVGYYLFREYKQPGFWSLVWNDELFPRYFNKSKNLEFSQESFWYYFILLKKQFTYWLFFTPLILGGFWFSKNKSVFVYLILIAGSFLLILSKGTKNFWYDAPLFPLLAMLLALSVFVLFNRFIKTNIWQTVLIVAVVILPYKKAYETVLNTHEQYYDWETYGISYYLKSNELSKNINSNTSVLLDNVYGFEPHLYYVKKLKLERGIELERKRLHQIKANDTLLITHLSTYDSLAANFHVQTLDSFNGFTKRVVISKK
jgi:4-amino-4-deoxy-L-arabinose transferase-like glycosyltransferase